MKTRIPLVSKTILFFVLMFFSIGFVKAQNVSTEGTDFWFGFLPHDGPGGEELTVFISTSQDTVDGTITIGTTVQSFSLGANSSPSFQYTIPSGLETSVTSSNRNTVNNRSIHIETVRRNGIINTPISVYALNKAGQFSADATIILPTNTLGKKYYATCHNENASPSSIVIIGTEDDTDIDIEPTEDILGGVTAGNTTSITLDKGETYLIESSGDLTGTKITTSNSTTGDCKNFSVFSGVNRTPVGGGCGFSQDHLFQHSYPVKTWGQNFTVLPFQDRSGGDIIKVVSSEDNTLVTINGTAPFLLDEGEVREININSVRLVSADKPISVTQLSKSVGCDPVNGIGDPFMVTLSPNEQLLRRVTFSAFPVFTNDFTYYVDIVSPTDGKSSVTLTDGTGVALPLTFIDLASGFSYAQVTLNIDGNHFISSDSGFIANVYGFGSGLNEFESFGYTTGASLNNLNFSIISIDTGQLVDDDTETLCLGNPISFSPDIDPTFQFFEWDMGDGTVYDTKDVTHVYNTPGIFNVTVKAFTSLGDCGSEQAALKTVEVKRADFSIRGPASVCPDKNPITYTVLNPNGNYNYKWSIDGGTILSGQNTDTLVIKWGGPNSSAFLEGIATNDLGCEDTTRLEVFINNILDPAKPIGPDSVCYAGITQKYEALLAPGNAYEWFVTGGTLTDDTANPDGNTVLVTWDTLATVHELWYKEFNLIDTICAGISDTFSLVTILPEIKQQSLTTVDVACFGDATGSFDFSAQGGIGNLNYVFGDTVPNRRLETNLIAGTYTVETYDEVGCSIFQDIEITQPDSIIISASVQDAICFGESTGHIDLTVTGGVAPYQYDWGTASTQDTAFLDQIPTGDYRVELTDDNGCIILSDTIFVSEADSLEFSLIGLDSVCEGSVNNQYTVVDDDDHKYFWFVDGGSVNDTATNPSPSAFITWWDATSTNNQIKVVSFNSDGGCWSDTLVYDVSIHEFPTPSAPVGLTDSLCYHDTLTHQYQANFTSGHGYEWFATGGEVMLDATDPTGPIVNVKWSTSTTRIVWFREYVIGDENCDSPSDSLIVTVLPEEFGAIAMTPVNCFRGSDGEILISKNGGIGDYTYDWAHDTSLDSARATGLVAGNYSVEIQDEFGCFNELSILVTEPDQPVFVDQVTIDSVDCYGDSTGRINLIVKGGTAPYTATWDDVAAQTGLRPRDLPAGTHTVIITDNNQCVLTESYTISESTPFSYMVTDTLPSRCKVPEGFARISASGGTAPYSFNWLTTGGDNGNEATELPTGENALIVTDDKNCKYDATVYINSIAPEIYEPNAFTPNGDGVNDVFNLVYTCDGNGLLNIYNRWGDLVYSTTDLLEGWTGKSNTGTTAQDLPAGAYIYHLRYNIVLDGIPYEIERKGSIVMIK